jgi:hypothetical protein
VPRISAFYGIVIVLYYGDHEPPHFHARYGEYEAQVLIATGELLAGNLPRRAQHLVSEWVALRRDELWANWAKAQAEQALTTIDPLP